MFQARELPADLEAIREEHAPDAIVLDAASDFEMLPPAQAEDLGLLVDTLDPHTYPSEWLPEDAPALLRRYAGSDFTIGMPGDASVAWTRQTDPPVVIIKPRVEGSPDDFVDFLIAEALVEVGLDVPEQFIGFFEDQYCDLDAAVELDPNSTYQIAAALYDAWLGLHTRDVFAEWLDTRPRLGEAWQDAGERIEGRLADVPGAMARGETDFADATELACSSLKHALELPAPFTALDTEMYRDRGPDYAVTWAEKTFENR
jgi:hypothetical protein